MTADGGGGDDDSVKVYTLIRICLFYTNAVGRLAALQHILNGIGFRNKLQIASIGCCCCGCWRWGGEGCFLSSSGQPSGNRNPVDGGVGEGQQAPAAAARSAAVDHDGHYVDGLTEASRGVVTSSVM